MSKQSGLSIAWAIVISTMLFVSVGLGIWVVEYRRGERAAEKVQEAFNESFGKPTEKDKVAAKDMAGKLLRQWRIDCLDVATVGKSLGVWTVTGTGENQYGEVIAVSVSMRTERTPSGRRWVLVACTIRDKMVYPTGP